MKKENDEITDLFRTRLADAGMNVRDGFWVVYLEGFLPVLGMVPETLVTIDSLHSFGAEEGQAFSRSSYATLHPCYK